MKKYLFIYSLLATAAAWCALQWGESCRSEAARMEGNCRAMSDSLVRYRTRLGREAASVEALQLRCDEFEQRHRHDAGLIRDLGIRLRRVQSQAVTVIAGSTEAQAPLLDTVVGDRPATAFSWSDGWVEVEGVASGDSVSCRVVSVDTLRQVVHRVPRRFLFIRYGTKASRQEIVTANPHNRTVCAEYIEFQPRRRRKQG